MASLLECVPNFSEGRNRDTVEALRSALSSPGVTLLDVQSDADHNRSVFSLIGTAEDLVPAVFASVALATEMIDLRSHSGAHPRMGATDVIPFVPLLGTSMEEAVAAARQLGERIASDLSIPVYFYEDTASSPDRRNLEQIRRKGFEELRDQIATDPDRKPDLGPLRVHPTAGATAVGARRALIAYNIYLNTADVAIAQAIARTVRNASGGLRYVKALGFDIPERSCVQVSMNLTNHQRTALHTVFEMVKEAATAHGVSITESEIVGLAPVAALLDAARHYLRLHAFSNDQALELRLLENRQPHGT